jgi:hypothetical protein
VRFKEMTRWLLTVLPEAVISLESLQYTDSLSELNKPDFADVRRSVQSWSMELSRDEQQHPDLIITMGGDGTLMYVASLFQGLMPPVICFNFGSLGFLANFSFDTYQASLTRVLEGKCDVTVRMRLQCDVETFDEDGEKEEHLEFHVLNEVVLDRGPSPYISNLQLYVDDVLVTVVQGDGLIIGTPTGSTAYSVGGSPSLRYPFCLLRFCSCSCSSSFVPLVGCYVFFTFLSLLLALIGAGVCRRIHGAPQCPGHPHHSYLPTLHLLPPHPHPHDLHHQGWCFYWAFC